MRDPATDLTDKELTNIAYQYLCERDLQETCEAINANFTAMNARLAAMNFNFDLINAHWNWRPPARKRGRPPQRRERHIQIAGAVAMLVEMTGLHPTRSHYGKHSGNSACSIVMAALEQLNERLGERTVEGIWDRHRRSPQLNHPTVMHWIRIRYFNRP
jgi:hypothetical protein